MAAPVTPMTGPAEASAGWRALRAGEWEEARAHFLASLELEASADAFEGLGWAGYFLDDDPGVFEAREQAYRAYRDAGDDAGAARVAAWLAADHLEFRGEPAVANGWIQRARRLLEGREQGPDHGWLAIHEASMCLLDDPAGAGRLGAEAAELGRRFRVPELEMVGLATEGQSLVLRGDMAEGMRRLDEASALALGEQAELLACVAWACCYLISACEQVRDYDRAAQWCVQVTAYCERYRIGVLLGQCRSKYAGVLLRQGRLDEAEQQLATAETELTASRPALVSEAVVRLADLRRVQGRTEEAAALYARCDGHLHAVLGLAHLAFDAGEDSRAHDLADRFLRRLPPDDPERAAGLELQVELAARLGDHDGADAALSELQRLAAHVGTGPLRAAVHRAEALVHGARGDHDAARRGFEDAIDLLLAVDAPLEVARVRGHLARSLQALGRRADAERELGTAVETFRGLGLPAEVARLEDGLDGGQRHGDAGSNDPDGPLATLTAREREVLGLVAQGLTNQQIAGKLVVSEHTVHRHVGNILRKLAVPSRTAAAALAIQAQLT